MSFFEVEPGYIESLQPKQLTDLLRRLLILEANRYRIPKSAISLSLKIEVPDGGEDGRIQWEEGPIQTDFVPKRLTMFQCKAQKMSAADCEKELRVKRKKNLKPQVKSIFDNNGTYILFCTQILNENQIKNRIEKFRECIKNSGEPYGVTADIKIYDANKIANWVNEYLSAITQVLSWVGRPMISGLMTWEGLDDLEEHRKLPFISNPGLDKHIRHIQEELTTPKKAIRIIGLSGLGKTRIAIETFRQNETLKKLLIYYDASLGSGSLAAHLTEWAFGGQECILVVDNCDANLHSTLQRAIERTNSRISLLTLDYDLTRIDVPIIEINPYQHDHIKKMLSSIYGDQLDPELDRITEFAQGFPKMAVLLAEAHLNETHGILKDDELLKKLLWGREAENRSAFTAIKACALFEMIGFTEEKAEEYKFIADKICRMSADEFYSHIIDFMGKKIIDQRGRFTRVVPLPLAIRLAADFWKHCSLERATEIIKMQMPGGLINALCDRFAKLDFLPEARDLIGVLCGETGPFGTAEVLLSEQGSRLFRSLVEVNPVATAECLDRIFSPISKDQLLEYGLGRRNIIRALEKLCFRRETFSIASRILLALASAENESCSNNATGTFLQLFRVHLSGTQATPEERLEIIREALQSSEDKKIIAVQALGKTLESGHFSRLVGAEYQGSGPALEEWRPTTWDEIFKYWSDALRLLTESALQNDDAALQAQREIADNVRSLIKFGRMDDLELSIKSIIRTKGKYWPEILDGINQALKYELKGIEDDRVKKLKEWKELLIPDSLSDQIRLIVSQPPWDIDIEGNDNIDKAEERAKEFAISISNKLDKLEKELPLLYLGEQRQGYAFGFQLANACKGSIQFINISLSFLKRICREEQVNTIVLAGYLQGLKNIDQKLFDEIFNRILDDEELNTFAIDIFLYSKPSIEQLNRILEIIKTGKIPVSKLRFFSYGRALEHLTVESIIRFVRNINKLSPDAISVSFRILYMYQFSVEERWVSCKEEFHSMLMEPRLLEIVVRDNLDIHSWQRIANKILEETKDEKLAAKLIEQIISVCKEDILSLNLEHVLNPLLKKLIIDYTSITWPPISTAILSENWRLSFNILHLIAPNYIHPEHRRILFDLPDKFLLGWCEENPDKVPPIVAQYMPIFERTEEDGHFKWNALAKAIIDKYGNEKKVLDSISANLGTFSWTGSTIPYYRQQVELMEQLLDHQIENVRRWAKARLKYLEELIKEEALRDDEKSLGLF